MEYKTLCTFLGKNYKANLINDSVLLRLCVHFWKKIINDSVSNQRLGWHLGKKIINDPGPLFDTLEYIVRREFFPYLATHFGLLIVLIFLQLVPFFAIDRDIQTCRWEVQAKFIISSRLRLTSEQSEKCKNQVKSSCGVRSDCLHISPPVLG